MSAPPAPNHIAKAIAPFFRPEYDPEWLDDIAQAVWDALLAEGSVRYAMLPLASHIAPTFSTPPFERAAAGSFGRVLVLPLAGLDTDTPRA